MSLKTHPEKESSPDRKRGRKPKEPVSAPVLSVRQAQKEFLLQRITDAARELFFSQGYVATTFDQIAEAAGARRSTLYKHFRDKEDILRVMAERYGDQMLEVAATLPGPVPSREEIDAWMQRIAAFIKRERTPTILMSHLSAFDESAGTVTHIGVRIIERLAQNVTAYRRALEPGPGQARAYAWAMIVAREVCLNSLQQAQKGKDEFARNLFAITGDIAEAFFRENS